MHRTRTMHCIGYSICLVPRPVQKMRGTGSIGCRVRIASRTNGRHEGVRKQWTRPNSVTRRASSADSHSKAWEKEQLPLRLHSSYRLSHADSIVTACSRKVNSNGKTKRQGHHDGTETTRSVCETPIGRSATSRPRNRSRVAEDHGSATGRSPSP